MDRHHLHHRHNHPHHHNNPDPRYIPLRPHHQHQSSLFRPPPLPPPPHGHLRPPPPQQPLPPPPPQQPPLRPPPPCFVHNPPLSRRHEGNFVDSSHHHQPRRPEGNFVTSLSHHHHHHPQPHRHPPRVVFDDDRNRFRLTNPDRVSDLDMDLDHCGPVPVRRPINFDRTVEIDDEDRFRSSRFREDLSFENPNSSRFYPVDEVQGRIDDRRVVEIDDQHYRHEQYLPDVLLSEFELNPGVNQCVVRGPRVDEVPIKVSRDEVNARRGVQPRSRDESHLPVKFRNRGIDIDDGFYEKGMNSPGSESGRYVDRGRREEIQDYSRSSTSGSSLRKNLQKKSAFLRIQPLKHTPNSSSRSSRFDTTPSPHKGKGKDKDKDKDKESLEYLDHKSSQDRGVSPVELDVSFKSNALVAKAIVGNLSTSPTDYNVNSDASDLNGARIGGSESPLKKEIVKKCEKSPSLSSKVEKGSEKKVIRFAMKRVGPSNNADSSKGSVDRGSLKVEGRNSDKGDKLSAPNARKRKKPFVWPSRLSGTVPAKTNAESLDKDKSQNQPSSSCVSEKCIKKSDKEVSSDDQVVGSADKETIELTVKFDLNECPSGLEDGAVSHSDSDSSCLKKSRKRGSSYEPKDGLENLNGIGEEVQKTSGSDEDFIKSIEKCSSDIGTGCNSSKDQDIVPLLVDCGSGEGPPEPVACLEGNLDSIDVDCGEVNMHNSEVVANATSSPLDVSNGAQLRIEETCTHDNHCETTVVLSSEISVVDIPFDGLHLDVGNIQSESSKSEELTNLAKVSNINVDGHKTNTTVSDGLVSVDSEILTTSSDINPTNDTEHQECQGAGTTSAVGEAREEPSRTIDLLQCSSPFSLEKDVSLSNRKRKVACKLDSLGSGVPASSCDRAVNVPVKDLDSVEKMSSAVSSSPCVIAESNVLHSNELIENPLGSMSLMNHGCDSDPIECYSSCSKKQKILSFEPVSSDALPSEKCDIPAPADTSVSMIEIPMNSGLSAVVIGLPNCLHTNKNVTGEGSDNLLTSKFVDNSKADFLCGESSLPVEENAHPNDKQSSFYSEPSKHQDIMNANMSEFGNGIRSVAVESEGRIATDHPNGSVPYLRPELSRDSDNETPVIDMECENNIISNDVYPSLSDSSQLCAESASDGLTGIANMMETPGNVASAGAGCLGAPTVDTSEIVSAVNTLTEMKGSIDDKGSSSMSSSLSNSLVECNEINLKPGVSASKSDKPFVPKTLLVPSKKANNLISSSNVLSRQHVGRNSYTGHASSVMTTSTKAPSTYPTKPRTWRRSDNTPASNTLVKKSSVSPAPQQRPPIDRTVKFRGNSYIRKGNSLVRNPVSNAASLGPHVSKPNETNKIDKIGSSGVIDSTVVHDTPSTMGQNTSIEMPKTPPLSCSDNASNSDVLPSEDCPFSPPVVSEGVGNEEALRSSESALHFSRNSTTVENRHVEDAGALSDGNLPGTSGKRVVYIKRKSHQLIAATNSPDPSLSNADMTPTLSSDISYYKRRKNQLIRASSESNIHQMVAAIDDSSSSQPQKASRSYMSKSSTKRPSNKVKPAKVSLVWKLGDRNSSVKGADLLGRGKLLSHLLPWKRATNWRSVWWSSGNMPNSSSLKTKIVGQKFLSSRKRTIVYMRSGRGFSLRRSKVVSVAGSSLKWSKSMERRSKKVDEEVSKAVAAARKTIGASNDRAESTHNPSHKPGERIFRIGVYRYRMDPSRRTLHRIPDEESADSLASMPAKDVRKTYVPKRLLIGSDEYVRIGNGNQLVRDPKRRTRILASEKIRWSLHTARTRLAKKRKFCQFFTRFGKCNKGEGKCHFIHDPSKIAVCTKFLNGLCSDPNCKLTHKVIPERMPDCSFFLQGLCSNENCPYRHVNVNPKASICESFLRGYCAEGNECRKKHSYSCPEYESSGSCPQGSRCKLYHPNKGKSQKRKGSKDQRNSRRRYFGSVFTTTTQPETVTEKHPVAPKNDSSGCPGGNLGDFISLDASDDEVEDSRDGTTFTAMDMSEGRSSKSQLDDDDVELITPFRLLNRH